VGKGAFSNGKIFGYIGMAFIVLLMGVPLFWMLSGSLKDLRDIYNPNAFFPSIFRWENYQEAWTTVPFGRFYLNSIIITAAGAALEIFCGVLCAYAFAFLRFPGKNFLFMVVLASLMVPSQVVIIPNFRLMAIHVQEWFNLSDNWVNTYQGVILPGAATAFGTFLMRQGFLGLPRDVMDAAKVDGAGHIRTMLNIMLPMAKPIVITFALISIVSKWNEYLWPLIITNTLEMRPITVGLRFLMNAEGANEWGVIMAGTTFVVGPMLVIYVFLQRYIIDGLTAGATKG
jgi:sn-glycerol 3-phosphate transport system permease protein